MKMWCVQQQCRGGRFRLYRASDVEDECFPDKKGAKAYMKQFEPFSKSCKHRLVRRSVTTISGPRRRRAHR